jgi:hypothetical protein
MNAANAADFWLSRRGASGAGPVASGLEAIVWRQGRRPRTLRRSKCSPITTGRTARPLKWRIAPESPAKSSIYPREQRSAIRGADRSCRGELRDQCSSRQGAGHTRTCRAMPTTPRSLTPTLASAVTVNILSRREGNRIHDDVLRSSGERLRFKAFSAHGRLSAHSTP